MPSTGRGVYIPNENQPIPDGPALSNMLRQLGLSTDAAIGSYAGQLSVIESLLINGSPLTESSLLALYSGVLDGLASVVEHGSDVNTPRPAGAGSVIWVGSVTPDQAVAGDIVLTTATPSPSLMGYPWEWMVLADHQGGTDGEVLTSIVDSSGNGRILTQAADATDLPTYTAADANFAGNPVINFDDSPMQGPTLDLPIGQPFTMVAVAAADAVDGFIIGGPGPRLYRDGSGTYRVNAGSAALNSAYSSAGPYFFCVRFNGASTKFRVRTNEVTVNPGSGSWAVPKLGSWDTSHPLTGRVALAGVMPGLLTDQEVTDLYSLCTAKWGSAI